MDKTNQMPSGGQRTQRNTNLELYRIIVMLLIVAHHYVVNSGLTDANGPIFADSLSGRSLFLLLFGAWGKTGINCFVLISGYFMCKSRIPVKKFVKLLGEVLFYNVVIQTIFWVTGYEPFTLVGALKLVVPVKSIGTGFTPAYLVFFLCIPFLNILVNHMSEKQHIKLLLLCSFLYIFLGTIRAVTMNYVSWFVVLYFFASYVRLYPKKLFSNKKLWGYASAITLLVSAASVVACTWLGTKLGRNLSYSFVTDSNTLLAVLTGISTFMFMKNVEIKHNPWINTISASTFGVLLIHANSDSMRQWLWQDVLNNVGVYSATWMPLHAIGSIIAIYIVCTALDYVRIKFVEAPCLKLWDKWEPEIIAKYREYEAVACEKYHIT